jgi:hypothetical protein
MKTNSKNHPVFAYLLEAIEIEENQTATNSEKIKYVLDCFNSEFNHPQNKKRYSNLQARFAEYLQGLPSCINIAFYNSDILELAEKWGSLPPDATEKQEDKILANYFNFMACKFFQLCKQNKVDYLFLY